MSKNIVILTVETYRGEKEAIMKKKVLKAGSAILSLMGVLGNQHTGENNRNRKRKQEDFREYLYSKHSI